jgi:hypothetical protein
VLESAEQLFKPLDCVLAEQPNHGEGLKLPAHILELKENRPL